MLLSYKNRKKLVIFLVLVNFIQSQYLKMEESMEKPLRNYVSVCKQGQLLPGRKMERSDKPKVTIIIPMYNEEKNILSKTNPEPVTFFFFCI